MSTDEKFFYGISLFFFIIGCIMFRKDLKDEDGIAKKKLERRIKKQARQYFAAKNFKPRSFYDIIFKRPRL